MLAVECLMGSRIRENRIERRRVAQGFVLGVLSKFVSQCVLQHSCPVIALLFPRPSHKAGRVAKVVEDGVTEVPE